MKRIPKYLWIDERSGVLWEIRHEYGRTYVWNKDLGKGCWDGGRNLKVHSKIEL